MDATLAVRFDAMAAHASSAVQLMVLRKSLDTQSEAAMKLIDTLPQKEGVGKIVDIQA